MIVEVKMFPESQEVIDNKEWFPIHDYGEEMIFGDSAYARVVTENERRKNDRRKVVKDVEGGNRTMYRRGLRSFYFNND